MSKMIIKTDFDDAADVEVPNSKETPFWNRDIHHALKDAGYKVKPLKKKGLIKKIVQVD